jgi:nicotinamidase-related amidase
MPRALILIDIQKGFDSPVWGARNNPQAEANAARLLVRWREVSAPVFHIRHLSQTPGSPLKGKGAAFKPEAMPLTDELIIDKSVNSAFIGTDLETRLRSADITDLVICGLTTPHCVSTTARMAANLGFSVWLAEDACAAFTANADMSWRRGAPAPTPQATHDFAVAHLHGEFVTVRSTDDILAVAP